MSLTSRPPTGFHCRSVVFIRDTQGIAKRKVKNSEAPQTMSTTVHFIDPAGMGGVYVRTAYPGWEMARW